MKKLILLSAIWLSVLVLNAQDKEQKTIHPIQISLAYPIGTAGVESPRYSNRLSLNVIYGINGGVNGLEMGSFLNIDDGDVRGAQLSGTLNINSESADGLLMAGFANFTMKDVYGVQMAGAANYSGFTKGWMISGAINKSAELQGVQIASVVNQAEEVDGVQLSGLMNIAATVKGIQIAPILNIADTSDYCIGLINLVKSGEQLLSVSVDETNTMLLSFRSGGRVMYGIVGAGYRIGDEDPHYAVEAGLGANLYRGKYLKLRAEAVSITLSDWDEENYFKSAFRLLPTVGAGHFELMAGPTFNFVHSDFDSGDEFVDTYLWEKTKKDNFNGLYIGFLAGINYKF